jgi:hypothetical protein
MRLQKSQPAGAATLEGGHFDHLDSGLHCSLQYSFCLDFFIFAAAVTIKAIHISLAH